MNYCPDCGSPINDEKNCPECGCPITSNSLLTIPCRYCGNMLAQNATNCPKCGGHLEPVTNCGTLRIVMNGNPLKTVRTPLYVNGQLIETVSFKKGCDISIPLTHPNITVTFKDQWATIKHTYTFNVQRDYILNIRPNKGFILSDNAHNVLSEDIINIGWRFLCAIFPPLGVIVAWWYTRTYPARSKYMFVLCLEILFLWLLSGGITVLRFSHNLTYL